MSSTAPLRKSWQHVSEEYPVQHLVTADLVAKAVVNTVVTTKPKDLSVLQLIPCSPFSRAVQAVLLYRLQTAKDRLETAGQLP
jgi:hypothetical protein